MPGTDDQDPARQRSVHPLVEKLGAYSWRLIAIAIVGVAVLWLLARMKLVVIPIVVALFLSRLLAPVTLWFRRRGLRKGLASAATILLFFLVLGGLTSAVVPSLSDEVSNIRPTLTEAVDDIEDWLVDDSPFNVSRETVDRLRDQAGRQAEQLLNSSDGAVIDSAGLVAEVLTGLLLTLLLTFFMLREGDNLLAWVVRHTRPSRREAVERASNRAWTTLGGYLRGASLLGVVEAAAIGLTLALAGGSLVVPVMMFTFIGAFVPIVGALAAGVLAVMVGLVTGGTGTAVAVAVVALIVQQLDNDLLAPIIYGKALSLHPVYVLLSVVAGGALFGLPGTLLAVPVVAVAVNVIKELRAVHNAEVLAVDPP